MKKKACKKNTNPLYVFFMPNPGPEGYREHTLPWNKSIHNSYFVISHVKNDFEYQVSNNVIIIKRVNRKLGCKAKP